jgi:hypothetical protein
VIDDAEIPRIAERARELITFADGLSEAGFDEIGRRARVVARDALEAVDALAAERSARRALQDRCERLQAIIGQKAYGACVQATRGR